jgi:hypothetical protein
VRRAQKDERCDRKSGVGSSEQLERSWMELGVREIRDAAEQESSPRTCWNFLTIICLDLFLYRLRHQTLRNNC